MNLRAYTIKGTNKFDPEHIKDVRKTLVKIAKLQLKEGITTCNGMRVRFVAQKTNKEIFENTEPNIEKAESAAHKKVEKKCKRCKLYAKDINTLNFFSLNNHIAEDACVLSKES